MVNEIDLQGSFVYSPKGISFGDITYKNVYFVLGTIDEAVELLKGHDYALFRQNVHDRALEEK